MRYGIRRNISTFTDTYVRTTRRVEVQYDDSLEDVVAVRVGVPPTDESYPATIAGAIAALRGSAP